MNNLKNLTTGSTTRQLFRLALPIMGTSFIQMAYSITDMAWVGRLGSEAVAAVGAVGILTWLSSSVALLNKVGAEVSVAQKIGANEVEKARLFAGQNITMALLLSLIWGCLLFLLAKHIITLFELKAEIAEMAINYLRIVVTAFPLLFMSYAITGSYNAAGISRVPFLVNGFGLIINMVLDPLFIHVFAWGTNGAAIATWLAQGFVFMLFLWKTKRQKQLLGSFPLLVKPRKKYAFHILKIGLPVVAFNSLFSIISLFITRIASIHGGHIGVTAITVGGQIEAVLWNTSQGLSTALSAFVGQNYAAKQIERVKQAYRVSIRMTLIFGSLCTALFLFFGTPLFSLVVPEREAYLVGGVYLMINGYSMIFMMCEITTQGIFYGLGKTIPPAIISISLNVIRIPLAILLASIGLSLNGVWWAISISSILKGCVSFAWLRTYLVKKAEFNLQTQLNSGGGSIGKKKAKERERSPDSFRQAD